MRVELNVSRVFAAAARAVDVGRRHEAVAMLEMTQEALAAGQDPTSSRVFTAVRSWIQAIAGLDLLEEVLDDIGHHGQNGPAPTAGPPQAEVGAAVDAFTQAWTYETRQRHECLALIDPRVGDVADPDDDPTAGAGMRRAEGADRQRRPA